MTDPENLGVSFADQLLCWHLDLMRQGKGLVQHDVAQTIMHALKHYAKNRKGRRSEDVILRGCIGQLRRQFVEWEFNLARDVEE